MHITVGGHCQQGSARGYTSMLARRAREATGLSQTAFAERYGLPVATLRDWEQGKRVADAAAKQYLRVITEIPDVIAKALGHGACWQFRSAAKNTTGMGCDWQNAGGGEQGALRL